MIKVLGGKSMEKIKSSSCCSGSSCDCPPSQDIKKLTIDFLYLDLNTCERCKGTESNLLKAINEVEVVLKAASYEILINKINIDSKESAIKYKFISSPTIRINGRDIDINTKESDCKDCGDICGDSIDCRVWTYENKEYTEPPKAMIINAILKEIYNDKIKETNEIKEEYVFPENLEKFFKLNNQ